ncbi:hypothetical protein EDB89DRAFT_1913204 [Lactarius sanguifluus]|nr:hypothetical protein EDB89DRAFT_1913204 [Lactarius sanguifluus]
MNQLFMMQGSDASASHTLRSTPSALISTRNVPSTRPDRPRVSRPSPGTTQARRLPAPPPSRQTTLFTPPPPVNHATRPPPPVNHTTRPTEDADVHPEEDDDIPSTPPTSAQTHSNTPGQPHHPDEAALMQRFTLSDNDRQRANSPHPLFNPDVNPGYEDKDKDKDVQTNTTDEEDEDAQQKIIRGRMYQEEGFLFQMWPDSF